MKLTHSLLKSTLTATVTIPLVYLINCSSALAIDVKSGGNILKNDTNTPAEDVKIGFKIPGFNEEILGGGITIFPIGQTVNIINQGLSVFDEHIIFVDPAGEFVSIPPNKPVVIDILVNSKKKNAIKWLEDIYLTGPQGVKLKTRTALAGFIVQPEPQSNLTPLALSSSPLSFTFTNDGNTELSISSITLGRSPNLIESSDFMTSLLDDYIFDNGGIGWSVLPDEQIELDVPFSLRGGEYLVANVLGTADPEGTDPFPVNFLLQHEEVPEPLTILGTATALGFGAFFKRKLKSSESSEKELKGKHLTPVFELRKSALGFLRCTFLYSGQHQFYLL
jgi:hypothetical protein